MSAQPDFEQFRAPELRIVTSKEIQDRVVELSEMHPSRVIGLDNELPEVLFKAAQIGILSTFDWELKVEWLGVMHKAVGPHHDY